MRVVCDCDLVIAPADVKWYNWLCAISGESPVIPEYDADYNLANYFPDFEEKYGYNPHSFWDSPYLYHNMPVIKGADKVLGRIALDGGSVLIASHTKGGHFSSKYKYNVLNLKNVNFSRGSGNGFFATKEKYLLPCDMAIDDRAENLVLFPSDVVKVHFKTRYFDPYLDYLKKQENVFITGIDDPWKDIENYLEGV